MALTVRLGPKTERTLNAIARRTRMSRSDVVRDALAQYGARENARDRTGGLYDAWLDVIGIVCLGVRDPAGTTGDQFGALVRARRRGRNAR